MPRFARMTASAPCTAGCRTRGFGAPPLRPLISRLQCQNAGCLSDANRFYCSQACRISNPVDCFTGPAFKPPPSSCPSPARGEGTLPLPSRMRAGVRGTSVSPDRDPQRCRIASLRLEARTRAEKPRHAQGLASVALSSKDWILSAFCIVRPISSRPSIRHFLRKGPISKRTDPPSGPRIS
jgi:hypothetical protein